ncbi:YopX family protein [Lactiplantibacillus plantarum]|uniref:YopX family protein n=1 Tax=Lactiplantibacillus plantarum TaxID=1590 RepID=UPI001F1E45BA|nr:YopX family protein [Lactiplantibacillus plantarum]MCF1424467.1 hypothetical protein [Lactiplantibacillus plantarum]
MIKFRVWDRMLNEYRILGVNDDSNNLGLGFEVSGGIGSNVTTMYHSVGDVVEQFTGLKDANSQDIYEGDIIQYSHHFYEYSMGGVTDRETGYIGTVVKNNGAFGIFINKISYTDANNDCYHAKDFVPFCEFDDQESDMTLKGNVHANPELLEEDND